MKLPADIKSQLLSHCHEYVDRRIQIATEALNSSQASANDESKSTAGDKHDTGKAMMQIEVEQFSKQLSEAQKLKDELSRVNISNQSPTVVLGSLVETDKGFYFISISVGKILVDNQGYFAVSISSPFAQAIKGLKVGEKGRLYGSEIEILNVM